LQIADVQLNIFDNLPPVIKDKAVFICAEKHVKKHKIAEKLINTERNEVIKMEEITKTEPNAQSTNTETQPQSKPEQQSEDKTPTVEELMAQLATEKANAVKNKQALDKALREKGEVTKALRAKQTAEEQEAEAKAEAERQQKEQYEETLKELNHIKAVSAYKNISENAVESLIEAVADCDHVSIAQLIDNEVKAAVATAKAEWQKSRPRVNAGSYSGLTKEQIMAITDRSQRRQAIAENPELFNI
jgi:hypothetical protein